MSWLSFIIHFTIISMIFGMTSLLSGQKIQIPLQHSTLSLKVSPTLHGRTQSQDMKHSTFMMQLYQTLIMGKTTDLSSLEYSILQDSDTILSIAAKNCSQLTNHWELSFDMSSITRNKEIQLAELKIPFARGRTHDVTLDISHSKESEGKTFLGTLKIDFERGTTLKTINITQMIQSYFHQGEQFNITEDIEQKAMPKNGHESSCREASTDRAVLVVFTKDNPSANLHGYPNLIQTVESSKHVTTPGSATKRFRRGRSVEDDMMMANFPTKSTEDERPMCRRVDMIVNFESLGWGDQIIYPKKINAYRCEGACPIPLSEIFKPTNYAYIKSLVKLYNSDEVDYPSCVPVKMRTLTMLVHEGSTVVMKNHEDMIVEECGCH
ncbi:nodal homolog 2-A-like [Anomaloglossus baeobatrachus]|uniref:nodal homolog 2-A-like n=1 Tax=Anomaloglossus baeobatrachus TaxID=238106 RepID=UPI003F50CCE2